MKTDKLLVEVRTEELPPLLLWRLADDFPDSLLAALQKAGFAADNAERVKESGQVNKRLATPRRLAALLEGILAESPPKAVEKRGPQVAACYDKEGEPTQALVGFMHSVGVTCEKDLSRREEKGREYVLWQGERPGAKLKDEMAALVEKTLLGLNAPRLMRWGENEFKFIRPVRGLTMLWGDEVLSGKVMGVKSEGETQGNKFGGKIKITSGADYEQQLSDDGVFVDIDKRRRRIAEQLVNKKHNEESILDDRIQTKAAGFSSTVGDVAPYEKRELITEVAAMCESPTVLRGKIDDDLMQLPKSCITICMVKHQRFFPLQKEGSLALSPAYLVVADNPKGDKEKMLNGFNSVLRARLRDVKFYYEEDKKLSLDEYVEKLKTITYHKKLGSQYERMERVRQIATKLCDGKKDIKCEDIEYETKIRLAALPTLMVGEYPNLLEDMGDEYFRERPKPYIGAVAFVANAYLLEHLIAMFGIGEKPSGSKDPHGLRQDAKYIGWRATYTDSSLRESLSIVYESFENKISDVRDEVYEYILERIRFFDGQYFTGYNRVHYLWRQPPAQFVEAFLSQKPDRFYNIGKKIEALQEFYENNQSSAQTIAAANKRINNIFRKSKINPDSLPALNESLFEHDEEHALLKSVQVLENEFTAYIKKEKFKEALQTLVKIAEPTDAFFNKVLVNADDKKIRNNRFALLARLRALLEQFADFSKLTA